MKEEIVQFCFTPIFLDFHNLDLTHPPFSLSLSNTPKQWYWYWAICICASGTLKKTKFQASLSPNSKFRNCWCCIFLFLSLPQTLLCFGFLTHMGPPHMAYDSMNTEHNSYFFYYEVQKIHSPWSQLDKICRIQSSSLFTCNSTLLSSHTQKIVKPNFKKLHIVYFKLYIWDVIWYWLI